MAKSTSLGFPAEIVSTTGPRPKARSAGIKSGRFLHLLIFYHIGESVASFLTFVGSYLENSTNDSQTTYSVLDINPVNLDICQKADNLI
jgi:hypothetical protein